MRRIFALLLSIALMIPAFGSNTAMAAGTVKPHIAIDSVPAIGDGTTVEGHIWFEGGDDKYGDYAVTMALEVTRGGTIWGPKPTYANPSVEIDSGSHFSCLFVTGGYDLYAERLYIYLIPNGFTPDDDIGRTEATALDKVVIDRYDDGRTEIQQTKEPVSKPSASPTQPPAPSAVFQQQKHPADTLKLSICYSPYTNGLSPETNSVVPMEQMRWQLNLICPYADTITGK